MFGQTRLDLAQFDTVAAELNLEIGSPEKFHRAVRQQTRQVTGLVKAVSWFGCKRMRHKSLGRQIRPSEITARQPCPAQIKFSRHTDRHRIEALVENVGFCIVDRTTDRHGRAESGMSMMRLDRKGQAPDRGLRRSIMIQQTAAAERRHLVGKRMRQDIPP